MKVAAVFESWQSFRSTAVAVEVAAVAVVASFPAVSDYLHYRRLSAAERRQSGTRRATPSTGGA